MRTFTSDQSSAKQNASVFFNGQKQHVEPAFFTPVNVQPKLTINQSGDVYEQEADAVADKVMRMANPETQTQPFFKPSIQRKCAHCEEEEKKIRRKESAAESVASIQTENYLSGLSGGRTLNDSERSFFEPRFGADFSNVKIHTDVAAAQSAQDISALAYTSGNQIVFNSGQYQPETESGKRLMAHELTHVVQQRGRIQPEVVQRSVSKAAVSNCGTTYKTCNGSCLAADNNIGVCQWGGITYGCRCRSKRGSEPKPPIPVPVPQPYKAPANNRVLDDEGGSETNWEAVGIGVGVVGLGACFASGVCEVGGLLAGAGAGIWELLTD